MSSLDWTMLTATGTPGILALALLICLLIGWTGAAVFFGFLLAVYVVVGALALAARNGLFGR